VVSPKYIVSDLHGEHPISQKKQTQPNSSACAAQLPPCLPRLAYLSFLRTQILAFSEFLSVLHAPASLTASFYLSSPPPFPPTTRGIREPSDNHRCQCGASPAPSSAPPRRRDAAPPRPSDRPRRCLPSTGAAAETSAGSRRSRMRRRGKGSRRRR
jgi:hypothetical protein